MTTKGKEFLRKAVRNHAGRVFHVTLCRIAGYADGPTLTLIAGQHGMEHIGPVMLADFSDEISEEDFRGTLWICPCANPLALEIDYEFYPEKEDLSKLKDYYYSRFRHNYCVFGLGRDKGPNYYNMNRLWQRTGNYGVAGEITKWIWSNAIENAGVVIDFHGVQGKQPYIYSFDQKSDAIARFFGIRSIHIVNQHPDDFDGHNIGYQVNQKQGRYGFCVEFSRQHELKEDECLLGKTGIRNVMKGIGMMDGNVVSKNPVYVVTEYIPLNAGTVGHIHCRRDAYEPVKAGEPVYEIRSIETLEVLERGVSPVNGVMGPCTFKPVSVVGEEVCWVGKAQMIAAPGEDLDKFRFP